MRSSTPMPLLCGALLSLAACAQPVDQTPPVRIVVKLVAPAGEPAAIAEAVSQAAGTSARYVASSSPQWHALELRCPADPSCAAAIERLRRDRTRFAEVELDGRRSVR